ncbi:MAG: DUF2510 domain-containing protein [Propionibacterium acidifaciens]
MPSPGWYPDPAGTPGSYRYWDGQAWSETTTTDPAATPPPGEAPTPVGGAGRSGGGRGPVVAIIAILAAVALVVVIVLTRSGQGTGGDVPEDTNSAAPTESAWDETSTPTPTPSSDQSSQRCPVTTVSAQTNQPSKGIAGGGLQAPDISGWDNSPSFYLDWVSDLHTLIDDVYPGWMSNVSVGALNSTDDFTDPTVSAHQTMDCYASSGYYSGYTGRKDLVDEATTVDGHQAWHMQAEVYVTMSNLPQVEGDVVDVYVVDVGSDDHFGVFISSVTIGDSARDKKVRDCIAGLKVVS